jgi:phosphoglycerate dehydrogenase-like enzyme
MTLQSTFLLLLLTAAAAGAAADQTPVEDFVASTGVRAGTTEVRDLPGWDATPTILVRAAPWINDALRDLDARLIVVSGTAEALEHAGEADVLVGFCDPELVAAATNLVWVQVYWAGVERCLASEKIRDGRVLLTNMQKMSSSMIGEHAIAMTLSLTRGLPRFARAMPDGTWDRGMAGDIGMQSLEGKTMLVAGLGGIGKQVARRAKALGMRVLATRNSSRAGPAYVDYVGLSDELGELAGEADVIVNALPLTAATEGMFDRDLFARMKKGTYFINVGRGKTVVTSDLLAALEAGTVAGAGLDVTDPEPLPADHPLWQRSDVIITPHVAGFGGSRRWHAMLATQNIRRYLAGEALLNEVDPARGY